MPPQAVMESSLQLYLPWSHPHDYQCWPSPSIFLPGLATSGALLTAALALSVYFTRRLGSVQARGIPLLR
jgi:hypothetical protein